MKNPRKANILNSMQQYGYDGAVMRQVSQRAMQTLACAAVVATIAGCGSGDDAPPVATVGFQASKVRVALGSPIELTYRFDIAPNAKIDGDYKVFVHVVREDGQQMWDDDHEPPTPTSQWKPGQTIQYTRTRFVPVFPFLGEAAVEMGLYRDQDRLPLQAAGDASNRESAGRAYRVGTLQLLPSTENIFVMFKSGWHQSEFAVDEPTLTWQWTQKLATSTFRNPKKDVLFYIEFDARADLFPDKKQVVTISSGDTVVTTFEASSSLITLQKIPITAAQLGNGDMAELRIEVDRTFVPAKLPSGGRDARELGIRVYHTFVESR